MQIKKINIENLKAAKYNPRKDLKPGDVEFEKLKRSIEKFGYVEPVIWNKNTGNVVGGHQRLKVLKYLGETEVDCVILDIDLNKEKALNVALNKISGAWDMPLLTDLMKELQAEDFDVTLTGFDMGEVSDLFKNELENNVKDDNFDLDKTVENIKAPISKQGDIWLLGKHHLMCGDSTKAEMVNTLMAGAKADLLLTDAPYGVSYKGSAGEIKNDNLSSEEFLNFLSSAFNNGRSSLKEGASFYLWYADSEAYNFRGACKKANLIIHQNLIWNKDSLVLGRQSYQQKHEPCLYGWIEGKSHYWGSDRKQTTVMDFKRPRKSELHPTMKPLELFAYQILNSTKINDIVLDLFAGSGTAIISSEQTNRICYSMEFDEKYADVITMRWIKNYGENEVFLIRNSEKIPYNNLK